MFVVRKLIFSHLLLVLLILNYIHGVDRSNFKTCDQSSFCRRCRKMEPGKSSFHLFLNNINISPSCIEGEIVHDENAVKFIFLLCALEDGTFRMKINERFPLKARYEVDYVLDGKPKFANLEVIERTGEHIMVLNKAGQNRAVILGSPFKVDLYSQDKLVISANARGLMRFEHLREKNQGNEEKVEGEAEIPKDDTESDPGAWEENFKSHHDSKPYGPSAVALDFTFPNAHYAYGLPEHADGFALKSTKKTDPYRLYNLDVFEYELDNGMALYGSVPVLIAHSPEYTSGVFWLNSAETWVDVDGGANQNVVSSIVNFVSRSPSSMQIETHFMSESGIIDVFFMLGPSSKDVFRQYSRLTGTSPLPPQFSLAYHQCRWNYNDEEDVQNIDAGFDNNDIPMDVVWLDIEHTDNKKYFTWDKVKFPQPEDMINNLTLKGRKMVAIVDPHIKRDSSYFFHNDAESNKYYVQTKEGKDYEGWCWPGSSSYPDYLNPEVRKYYSSRYLLNNYQGSTLDLFIWNDMNEPSVFNGPEVTMPKDCVHYGGWEHRDIHNIYGLLYTMATFEGLLERSGGTLRPFILTRSHFAGSQRYTAVWTGDNAAEWGHLKITIPMCLSLSVAGISFCGADVGGFFKFPEPELMARWYQAAAFQPFFRAHSHIDTKRREPWLYDRDTMLIIREAIRKRYSFLPYWYTLFFQHEQSGIPVMRPLWVEFPTDTKSFPIDDEYLLGTALLVHPVTEQGVTEVSVYLPGTDELYYDIDSHEKFSGGKSIKVSTPLDKIPVFQIGGSIIPKKERIRRSSALSQDDPYTLIVALNKNGTATGFLYIDDGKSYDYREGKYLYIRFFFDGKQLSSRSVDATHQFPTKSWLERVIIMGLNHEVQKAYVQTSSKNKVDLEVNYNAETDTATIRKPAVNMADLWTIVLQ